MNTKASSKTREQLLHRTSSKINRVIQGLDLIENNIEKLNFDSQKYTQLSKQLKIELRRLRVDTYLELKVIQDENKS